MDTEKVLVIVALALVACGRAEQGAASGDASPGASTCGCGLDPEGFCKSLSAAREEPCAPIGAPDSSVVLTTTPTCTELRVRVSGDDNRYFYDEDGLLVGASYGTDTTSGSIVCGVVDECGALRESCLLCSGNSPDPEISALPGCD